MDACFEFEKTTTTNHRRENDIDAIDWSILYLILWATITLDEDFGGHRNENSSEKTTLKASSSSKFEA